MAKSSAMNKVGVLSTDSDFVDGLIAENKALRQRVEKLEELAARDTLTPLYNRRHFMAVLESCRHKILRRDQQYTVIYIDVDNLKGVNDSFGHAAGDAMLIAIADLLQNNLRSCDVAARLGGDEFVILLDCMPVNEAKMKAECFGGAVARLQLEFDGKIVQPHISLGYANVDPQLSPEDILAEADRHMYAQKLKSRAKEG